MKWCFWTFAMFSSLALPATCKADPPTQPASQPAASQPATMPAGLRAFAGANPISHLVTAERGLTAGQVLWVLAATVPLTALLTTTLYRRRG